MNTLARVTHGRGSHHKTRRCVLVSKSHGQTFRHAKHVNVFAYDVSKFNFLPSHLESPNRCFLVVSRVTTVIAPASFAS